MAFTTDQIQALSTTEIAAMSTAQSNAFEVADIQAMSTAQIEALVSVTPIVLDLPGHGGHITAAADGVNFDLTGNGHASKVGWVGKGSGLLAMDKNGDGVINGCTELFGVATQLSNGQGAGNGFNALADLDSHYDSKIDAHDAQFAQLKVWVDTNHDGKTDAVELKGLGDLGITELDLIYVVSSRVDNGNAVGLVSAYKTADGRTHGLADVWFAKDPAAGKALPKLNELLGAPTTDVMPPAPASSVASAASTTAAPVALASAEAPTASVGIVAAHRGTSLDDELLRSQPLI